MSRALRSPVGFSRAWTIAGWAFAGALALSCEDGAEADRPSSEPTASAPGSTTESANGSAEPGEATPAARDAGSTPEVPATDAGADHEPAGSALPTGAKPSAPSSTEVGKTPSGEASRAKHEGEAEPDTYSGSDPCTTERFEFAAVRNACETGGQPAAKALMKRIVKKAKADGEDIKCSSCHESIKSYSLRPNAVSDMRKLL